MPTAFGEHPDQIVVPVGHETRQQAETGAGAGGLDVHEDIGGGHRFAHGGRKGPCEVKVVDLQHGVDEIDERIARQILDAVRRAVFA